MESRDGDYSAQRDVLIVSATPVIREVLHDMLLTADCQCLLAGNGHEAIEIFRGWRPSLVITDFNLSDMCALELLQDLRQEDPDVAVIVLCGDAFKRGGEVIGFLDKDAVRRAGLKLGAHAILEKPVDMDELLLTAERALTSRQIQRARRQPLQLHWGAVRPMVSISELLGTFAAVFTVFPRRAGDRRPAVEVRRRQ